MGAVSADTAAPPTSSRRGANLVAAGILLSRVAGLAREMVIAQYLGAGAGVEAFRSAFRIPNLMQNLLGEGVLSASFIPVYRKFLDEGRDEDAGRLAGAIAGLLIALTGVLVIVGVVAARPITSVIAFGFTDEKFELTVSLVRILTPGIGVLVLSAWCLGVLNSHRRFFLPYVAPVLWNVVTIAVLVGAALRGFGEFPLTKALAWGIVAGSVAQLLIQIPAVLRLEPNLRLSTNRDIPGVQRVLRAFTPVVGSRGVVQVSAFVDIGMASVLATGGLASLGYAQVLYVLPISLFGMSIAAAELPDLASMDVTDREATLARVSAALERVAFFVVPVAAVFLVRGDQVVGTLFRGFEPDVVEQVGLLLAVYSLALIPTTASRVIQSLRFGLGDTRTPARASIARVIVSTTVALLVMFQFDQFSTAGPGRFNLVGTLPAFSPVASELRGLGPSVLRLGALGFGVGAAAGSLMEFHRLRHRTRNDVGLLKVGGGRLGPLTVATVLAVTIALVLTPSNGTLGLIAFGLIATPIYIGVCRRLGITEAGLLWNQGRQLLRQPAIPLASRPVETGWSWAKVLDIQRRERERRNRNEK